MSLVAAADIEDLGCTLEPLNGNNDSPHKSADDVFFMSEVTTEVDVFISYVWGASRILKALAMLYCVNLRFAVCVSVSLWIILASACVCIRGVDQMGGEVWLTPMFCYLPVLTFMFCFTFGHYIRPGVTTRYWLDKLCIHQSRSSWKRLGVSALPEFVANSRRMLVLWSEDYFERLWCNSEIATFMATSSGGADNIDIQPLWLAPWVLSTIFVDCVCVDLVDNLLWMIPACGSFFGKVFGPSAIETLFLTQFVGIGLVVGTSYLPAALVNYFTFKLKIHYHNLMLKQLKDFSIKKAKCAFESDRAVVEQLVIDLANDGVDSAADGALTDFDLHVRSDIRHRIKAKIGNVTNLPYSLSLLVFMPFTFESLNSIFGCDGAPCEESATLQGYSSTAQYQLTNAASWMAGVLLVTPLTYPMMLNGLNRVSESVPNGCLQKMLSMVVIVLSYYANGFLQGLTSAVQIFAVTTSSSEWIAVAAFTLSMLGFANWKVFHQSGGQYNAKDVPP